MSAQPPTRTPPEAMVVFATHDGGDTLARTLSAMANLAAPAGGWRLLVIDNAGDAQSHATLQSFATSLPLEILVEPCKGKNRALNRALTHLAANLADIELVVFTDDDVIPERDWLLALLASARAHPDADLFGGKIEPAFETPPPAWLAQFDHVFDMLFARTAHQDSGPCAPEALFGPNLAIRGAVLADGPLRFDEAFGPDGGAVYAMGSETELCLRLSRAGRKARFVAEAKVSHLVASGQMQESWVLARAFRHGLGEALRLRAAPPQPAWPLCLNMARMAASGALKGALALALSDSVLRRAAAFNRAWARGAAAGLLRPR